MNLLVTGGCGFIGSHFIRTQLGNNKRLKTLINLDKLTYAGNLDNLSDITNDSRYQFIHGDIADSDLLKKLFGERPIDAVINFAAESHVDHSIDSPEPFFQTNVMGTLRLLEAARSHWNSTRNDTRQSSFRFLQISTDEVYGSLEPDDPAFTETNPFCPNSPYAASKASSDHIVRAYHHTYGMPTLITNSSNNYGPYQFPEKLIPLIILNALEGKPLPLYGNGSNIRDWLHVEDHCEAISIVLEKGTPGATYNIGGLCQKKTIEVVDSICHILDTLSPSETPYSHLKTFVKDRPGHDQRYAINGSKIKDELGWQPKHTFASGLKQTIRWYINNHDWCHTMTLNKDARRRQGVIPNNHDS